jgi:PAS domain S-box-containing protein
MINASPQSSQWTERSSANGVSLANNQSMFKLLFERSADATWLFDTDAGVFVDCNQTAVELMGATSREQILNSTPAQLAPPIQPDGRPSEIAAAELTTIIRSQGSTRFEWMARRFDGRDVPLEVLATTLVVEGRNLQVIVSRDITERKRAEEKILELNQTLERRIAERTSALTASEARLRTLVEHAPEAIVVFDAETGRFLSGNTHACRLYGRNASELLQLTPADVSPEFQPNGRRSAELARENMVEALRNGTATFEWMHQRTDGRLVPTEVRLVRLPAEGQSLLCATIIDNTERIRREQALRRRNDQMQRHRNAMLELAQADKSDFHQALGKICCLSATTLDVARVSYWSLQENDSAIVCETIYLREAQRVEEQFKGTRLGAENCAAYFTALATRMPIIANDALTHSATSGLAEGYLKPMGITSMLDAPVWVRGEVVGVLCHEHIGPARQWSAEEIDFASALAAMVSLALEESNRARSERQLRESEQKFRALFEASSQGVMLHDENQYLEVNPAIVQILGYDSPKELIGLHPSKTSPPVQPNGEDTGTLAQKYIQECLTKGHVRFEWVARRKNGEDIPVEVILTRIQWSGKQIIQAAVNDISKRKRAETELLKTLEREKELGQLKSNFVSMVSHEFRTPLGIIQSSAEILNDYLGELDEAERAEQLGSITSNTRRMAEMMEEILVLSRLDAGRMEFKPINIDLNAFCRRIVDEVHSATNRRCGIELSLADVPGQARADERLLGHVFTNLLGNALKYSLPDATVHFGIEADGEDAVCIIRDRGIGIPDTDQQWLFHAFQRGGNVGERPGTGLGLVIVKRCVELHGGKIKIKSKSGEGTEVTVRLPLFRIHS